MPEVPAYEHILAGGNRNRHVERVQGCRCGEHTAAHVLASELSGLFPHGEDEEVIDEVDHALPECGVSCGARFGEGQLRDSDVIASESLPELERGPLALGKSFVDVGADDRGIEVEP